MKKLFLLIQLFATGLISVKANIEDDLPTASIGYMITDLRSGNVVTEYNSDKLLVPASVMKVVTVAAALNILNDDFRFKTCIYSDGITYNDTIFGNLYIEGSGDPTLHLNLIDSIKGHSISHICGNILTNAKCPEICQIWMVEDIGSEYGVGWSHLNYKNNEILINDEFRASELDAVIADIAFDLSLNDISIGHNDLTGDSSKQIIATIHSPELISLCKELMHKSINLYAEAIGRAITAEGNSQSGLEAIRQYLIAQNIDEQSFHQKDFCGLARTNLIAPGAIVNILSRNADNKSFLSTFPMAGKDGTLKRLLASTPLKGQIIAKSGSMDGILTYAGYRINFTGQPTHAFAIMVNNSIISTSSLRKHIEKWFMKYFL